MTKRFWHQGTNIYLETVISVDNSEDIKQLSFVFVYTLHLNIKHCIQTDLQ